MSKQKGKAEGFILEILASSFPDKYQEIYAKSKLLQYINRKSKAIHGNVKARRNLANVYAIYSILFFYQDDFYNSPDKYQTFVGYEYSKLFRFYRSLYGGSKLQNHALNSRVNGEFKNDFPDVENNLIIINSGKYLLHIDYLYVDKIDISRVVCRIIEQYIQLLQKKDQQLSEALRLY